MFGHWAITSLVHAHINPFLSTGFTVVIIHNQQYEILIWSTSSKYRVLKFVVHINNEVKNKTTTVDTEVVDYNRGDLYMVSKKKNQQKIHTPNTVSSLQTHQSMTKGQEVSLERSREVVAHWLAWSVEPRPGVGVVGEAELRSNMGSPWCCVEGSLVPSPWRSWGARYRGDEDRPLLYQRQH